MSTFLDILKDFFETAKNRIRDPFIGSFIIAWIVFNWKSIIYLFYSTSPIEIKIKNIETVYTSIYSILLYPLIASIFYVLALPYVLWTFEYLIKRPAVKRKSLFFTNQESIYDSMVAMTQSKLKLEHIKADFKEVSELNERIDILNNTIEEKDSNIKKLNADLKSSQDGYNSLFNENLRLSQSKIDPEEEFFNGYNNFVKETEEYFKNKSIAHKYRYDDSEMEEFNKSYQSFRTSIGFLPFYMIGNIIVNSPMDSFPDADVLPKEVYEYYIKNGILEFLIEKHSLNFTRTGYIYWYFYVNTGDLSKYLISILDFYYKKSDSK